VPMATWWKGWATSPTPACPLLTSLLASLIPCLWTTRLYQLLMPTAKFKSRASPHWATHTHFSLLIHSAQRSQYDPLNLGYNSYKNTSSCGKKKKKKSWGRTCVSQHVQGGWPCLEEDFLLWHHSGD
jgi:hypothetical protein